MSFMKKLLRRVGMVLLGLVLLGALAIGGAILFLSKPLPEGVMGPEADALAHSIEAAIHKDAWQRTGAIRWSFSGRDHLLWDRQRSYTRVTWGDNEVLLDLTTQKGVAFHKGVATSGEKQTKLLGKAYAIFCNDSFWLNPLVKFFDDGVERRKVMQPDGTAALLITYKSGGVTPGDSYLWLPGANGVPAAWRMWVSVLPIKGLRTDWDNWLTLPTGAILSTSHKLLGLSLRMTDIAAAHTLAELSPGADPFAPLLAPH